MGKEIGNIEAIDTVTMYKMIQSLFRYDYFSTKCFVNLLIEKRTNEEEIERLNEIGELLFYQKNQAVIDLLKELICHERKK